MEKSGNLIRCGEWSPWTDAVIIDIFQWFKLTAARREDYNDVLNLLKVPEKAFCFVQCRWLSLLPALERVLQQWNSLQEYFLKYLPAKPAQLARMQGMIAFGTSYSRKHLQPIFLFSSILPLLSVAFSSCFRLRVHWVICYMINCMHCTNMFCHGTWERLSIHR